MDAQTRELIVFAIIGIIAGFLASLVVGGDGLIRYLITGLTGAFVGGYLFRALGINLGIRNAFLSEVITAAIGAIIVVLLARLIA
ncbi:GlsB/YeaQ/YmgE family stress response membrane protein [Hyphomicrobium sp. 99]|uniref:GlsB/YeaQ/YmgE family stress response membrane protein n=1 Tax=Hyphomicrobium sp. 99 TaxID=1163419 RepID=UPI0005F83F57|nr:GlsB/YeaQ/YmgE family stress response membrane protein [Hyphomicrobium sp. 99]